MTGGVRVGVRVAVGVIVRVGVRVGVAVLGGGGGGNGWTISGGTVDVRDGSGDGTTVGVRVAIGGTRDGVTVETNPIAGDGGTRVGVGGCAAVGSSVAVTTTVITAGGITVITIGVGWVHAASGSIPQPRTSKSKQRNRTRRFTGFLHCEPRGKHDRT